jgi:hypothetical protein
MQWPKPPGRSLMSVRGNAAPRGMTAHDRIRLIGPFAEILSNTKRQRRLAKSLPALTIFSGVSRTSRVLAELVRIRRVCHAASSANHANSATMGSC